MGIGNLPDGWTLSTLGEIADLIGGGTPSREHPEYFTGNHVWLTPTEIPHNRVTVVSTSREKITDEGLKKSSARLLPKGTVLMTSRASIGYVAIAGTEVTTNQGFASFICKDGVYNHFLAYWLLGNADYFVEQATGTTFKEITKSKLRNFSFPLPPLPEQGRIVAKIEELFTQLDAGTAALKRVRAGLKRYKASVLKAAVEGKLLESRGIENSDELPDGWIWATVAELAAKEPYSITDGPFGSKLKTEHYTDVGPRVMRLQNIGEGEFRDAKAHISQEHFETLKRHRIYAGDLVIAGLGESLPRACIIPDYVGDAIVKADCIRLKPNSQIADAKYLLFALNSETIKKLVAKIVHGIGRPRMNQQEIKAIPIPLPPLSEQRRIVAEVERRLSVAQEVESVVAASVARAGRLRQSILKNAFEGKLQ